MASDETFADAQLYWLYFEHHCMMTTNAHMHVCYYPFFEKQILLWVGNQCVITIKYKYNT